MGNQVDVVDVTVTKVPRKVYLKLLKLAQERDLLLVPYLRVTFSEMVESQNQKAA